MLFVSPRVKPAEDVGLFVGGYPKAHVVGVDLNSEKDDACTAVEFV